MENTAVPSSKASPPDPEYLSAVLTVPFYHVKAVLKIENYSLLYFPFDFCFPLTGIICALMEWRSAGYCFPTQVLLFAMYL